MDNHYAQVMQARAAAVRAGAPDRLYFAYSTVLDRAAFLEWRSQHGYDFFELGPGELAEAPDLALVYDFPSRFWGGRVAGLERRPGARVYGLVFTISGPDWPIIGHKEGTLTGMCIEQPLRVRLLGSGEEIDATAFTTRPERRSLAGPISARFVEALLRGARSAGLPEDYLAGLASSSA